MVQKTYFLTSRRKDAEFPISLFRRRQWFDDGTPPTDPPMDPPPPEDPPEPPGNVASLMADLQKERSKNKALRKRIEDTDSEREELERQARESAGEWKALYEAERKKVQTATARIAELEKDTARVEALETVINASNAEMVKQIPKENLGLLPLDNLRPEEVYAMLPQWINHFAPPKAVSIGEDGGQPGLVGDKKGKLTNVQREAFEMGVRAGVWKPGDEEKYLAQYEAMGGGVSTANMGAPDPEAEARAMIAQGQQMLQGLNSA